MLESCYSPGSPLGGSSEQILFLKILLRLISSPAVSLINNLLQVSVRRRFTVGKALGHSWLQVRHFTNAIIENRLIL